MNIKYSTPIYLSAFSSRISTPRSALEADLAPRMEAGLAPRMESDLALRMEAGLAPRMEAYLAPPKEAGLAPPKEADLAPDSCARTTRGPAGELACEPPQRATRQGTIRSQLDRSQEAGQRWKARIQLPAIRVSFGCLAFGLFSCLLGALFAADQLLSLGMFLLFPGTLAGVLARVPNDSGLRTATWVGAVTNLVPEPARPLRTRPAYPL
jgi:hypothetical protein